MVFWILTAILLLVVVWVIREEGFGAGVTTLLLGSLLGFLAVSGVASVMQGLGVGRTEYWAQKENLKALNNGTGIKGQFYLGSGTIGTERQINYITAVGNANLLKQLPAAESAVIEDTPKEAGPYVVTRCFTWKLDWLAPMGTQGVSRGGIIHEFHVPPGSVLEGYVIDNAK